MVAIIDYGLGNLASIQNMFKKIGVKSVITSDHDEIKNADKLLLPGVGHFSKGMENLTNSGLIPVIEECIFEKKTPILGICLGMQLMTKGSEEGDCKGLGWIDAQTVKFKFEDNSLKIPHMGWSDVKYQSRLIENQIEKTPRYYFVHSFYVVCEKEENVLATCFYGKEFVCGIQKANIFGVQFHPEKSHSYGKKLLTIFSNL